MRDGSGNKERGEQNFENKLVTSILINSFMKHILLIAAVNISLGVVFTGCSGNANKPGTEQLAKDETYTCTMHNEVMSDHQSKCPKCGMNLVKQKMTATQQKMKNEGTYLKPKG